MEGDEVEFALLERIFEVRNLTLRDRGRGSC